MLTEMALTAVQLAIALLYLIITRSPEACGLTACKFQVITFARNIFTWKGFAFTKIVTLQT